MKKGLIYLTAILILFCSFAVAGVQPIPGKAKGIIIVGKISDPKNNELLAGVKIQCSNCDKTFYSDLNGNFFIYLETDNAKDLKLEFSQIGYTSQSLAVQELQTASDNLLVNLISE
jgi:hypothetical protein